MKYGKKRLALLIFILSLGGLFIVLKTSFAQSPTPANYDVTVSPVFLDLSENPGDTINTKIRIRNNTTSPLPIKLEVKKMTGDANGDLTLKDTSSDNSLTWFKFESNTFVAKPLEWTDIPFTITIPKDAAYGYYFAISFTQDTGSSLKTTGTAITGAAAIPVLLDVRKAGAKAEAKIVDFSTSNYVSEYLPVDFKVVLQNSGNVHILPHGNIFISSGTNKNIAAIDFNPGSGNIIPSTKRIFDVSWSDGFLVYVPVMENGQPKLDKNGKQVKTLQINWNKLTSFRVGKYTADLIVVYDDGTKDVSLEKSINFWVIPYKALAVIAIVIILLVLVIRYLLKSYINREVKKKLKE